MFVVYKHTTPNGKVYIGITGKEVEKRWQNGYGYKTQKLFWRAIEKYGWNNIKHEILFYGLSKEQAEIVEQMQIALYDSTNPLKGYNISRGGDCNMLGLKHTEETKQKMSQKAKGRKIWCEGKKLSSEHIEKLKKSHQGYRQSEDTKRKRAEKLKGHFVNKEKLNKRVIQLDKKGNPIKVYESISVACKTLGISTTSHISECCRGKRKTANGYCWKYY